MSMYLSRAELEELTGYTMRSAVISWLDRNEWPYVNGGIAGWPRVLRQFHDQKLLGMKIAPATKRRVEPNWTRE